ncbi:MAG: LysR family transcriptional regulator [Inquilinus sp.]|uniref:LysR family transcriptional regulator n=1 Tax=Inquilinus sp. TaxID=1932117 RepID=UPI003F337007
MRFDDKLKSRHFHVAYLVNETGSMTKTAEVLSITQSAISKTIREIEETAGDTIFHRLGNKLVATEAGNLFLRMATRVLNETRIFREEMDLLKKGNLGDLTIGVQAVVSQSVLAAALGDIITNFPNIKLRLIEGTFSETYRNLRAQKLDLAMARMVPEELAPDLAGLPAFVEPYSIIASVNHPIFAKSDLSWSDLLSEYWILPLQGTPIRRQFEKALAEMQYDWPRRFMESNIILANQLLHGEVPVISLIQTHIATNWQSRNLASIVPLNFPLENHPIGLIQSTSFKLSPAAGIFKETYIDRNSQNTNGALSAARDYSPL